MQVQSLRTHIPQASGILKTFRSQIQQVQRQIQHQTAGSMRQLVSVRV